MLRIMVPIAHWSTPTLSQYNNINFLEIFPQYRYTGNSAIMISRFNNIILTLPWHIVKPGFHCMLKIIKISTSLLLFYFCGIYLGSLSCKLPSNKKMCLNTSHYFTIRSQFVYNFKLSTEVCLLQLLLLTNIFNNFWTAAG